MDRRVRSVRGQDEEETRVFPQIWTTLGLRNDAGSALPFGDAATVAKEDPNSLASKEPERCFDWTGVDATLREELQYLGLLVEIKAFFDALDEPRADVGSGGCNCFPVLRFLSLCSPGGIELSPEQEIRRVISGKMRRPWIRP
jgi:hypothetical protein